MNQSFFIDGIENIALAEGVVRMDCIVIEMGPKTKQLGAAQPVWQCPSQVSYVQQTDLIK